LKIIKSFTIQ